MKHNTIVQVEFTAEQIYFLLRVLEHDERMHPSEAMMIAQQIRKAVSQAEESGK